MEYRKLGRTDLSVSALSLGTVALGMAYGIGSEHDPKSGMLPPSDQDSIKLIHRAIDNGINFIDTARAYGRSEEIVGQALQNRRHQVVLTTKVSCQNAAGERLYGLALRQHMHESLTTSLRLLHTDHVDLLLLHSASVENLQDGEVISILKDLQTQGLARYVGASTYGNDAPRLAIQQGIDVLQVAYNILDQRMADAIFPLAKTEGVGVVVRSVYLKGVLTPRADDLPPHLNQLKEQATRVRDYAAQLIPPLALVEIALRFVISQSAVASALVGVHSESELTTALDTVRAGQLSAEDLKHLEQLRWDNPTLLNPSTWGIP